MSRSLLLRLVPLIIWIALVLPAVLTGLVGPSEGWDQDFYHRPVVQILSAQLPSLNFNDFGSATTPGYHVVLAVIHRLGASDLELRLLSSLFGLAAAVALCRVVTRLSNEAFGAVASAVLLLMPYVMSSAVFLTTDDLALFGVTLAVAAAVDSARAGSTSSTLVRSVTWSCAASIVRQVLLWTAGLQVLAVLMRWMAGDERRPLRALTWASIAMLPAVALIGWFVWIWGGLVPPGFQRTVSAGINFATPIYALALMSCWGGCIAAAHPQFFRALRSRRALLCGLCALGLALLTVTAPDSPPLGTRWGGILWNIAARFPVIGGRSLVLVTMAAAGGVVIGTILEIAARHPRRSEAWTALSALALGVVAQMANTLCFERYLAPIVIVCTALAIAPLLQEFQSKATTSLDSERGVSVVTVRLRWPLLAALVGLCLSVSEVHMKLGDPSAPPPRPDEFRPTL